MPQKIQLNTHVSINAAVLRQTNANLHQKNSIQYNWLFLKIPPSNFNISATLIKPCYNTHIIVTYKYRKRYSYNDEYWYKLI